MKGVVGAHNSKTTKLKFSFTPELHIDADFLLKENGDSKFSVCCRFQEPEEETNGKMSSNNKGNAKCKRQRSVSGSSASSVHPSLHTNPAGKESGQDFFLQLLNIECTYPFPASNFL